MLWVPKKGPLRVEHNTGAVGTATPGTSVTTSGTASVKGTPAELIAATAFEAYWLTVVAANYGASATDAQCAMDILIGGATEDILIPDLLAGGCGDVSSQAHGPKIWQFPLYIPAGSRLAVQAAGARLSTAFQVWVYLYGGDGYPPFRVGSKVTTYGISTVPNGTTVAPGASGAAATFTQMTASTSEDHFALVPSFQVGADTVWVAGSVLVSLGVGAATADIVGSGYWFMKDQTEKMGGPLPSMPTFVDVPAGSRLTLGASHSGVNDASYSGCIHAVSA